MKGQICKIKLELSGKDWNNVKLVESDAGRCTEHEYYSCSKKLVMKLLNSSKEVTINDFDGWFRDEKDERKSNAPTVSSDCWFGS